jgi:hypothetical protein
VIPRIIPSSASVKVRPQNARPSPIVIGIASNLLDAGLHAYVTGIFEESPGKSLLADLKNVQTPEAGFPAGRAA